MTVTITFTGAADQVKDEVAEFFNRAFPTAATTEQLVAVNLNDQLQDLVRSNELLAKEATELEARVDEREETLVAIARLIGAVPDATLPATVESAFKGLWARIDRLIIECDESATLAASRADRIAELEGELMRLRASNPAAPLPAFKPGDLVTVTWPDGLTTAPGIIRGSDTDSGRFQVDYYDMPPANSTGETWAEAERLALRSGNEPGDPPAPEPEKPKRTRKPKAAPAEPTPEVTDGPLSEAGAVKPDVVIVASDAPMTFAINSRVTILWRPGHLQTPATVLGLNAQGRYVLEYEVGVNAKYLADALERDLTALDVEAERTWPEGVSRDEYREWKTEQHARGVTERVDPQEYKRLKDAGLIVARPVAAPAAEPTGSAAVTPDGKWATDLDPAKGESRPAPAAPSPIVVAQPNPAAPLGVQQATKASAMFEKLPPAKLAFEADVWALLETGEFAKAMIENVWGDGVRVQLLTPEKDRIFLPGSRLRAVHVAYEADDFTLHPCIITGLDRLGEALVDVLFTETGRRAPFGLPVGDLRPAAAPVPEANEPAAVPIPEGAERFDPEQHPLPEFVDTARLLTSEERLGLVQVFKEAGVNTAGAVAMLQELFGPEVDGTAKVTIGMRDELVAHLARASELVPF